MSRKFIAAFISITATSVIFLHITLSISAAASPWSQTSWVGGTSGAVISNDVNTFSNSTSINYSVDGQLTLGANEGWYDSNWLYRKSITINNSGSTQTDYQVLVQTNTSSLVSAAKLQTDCDDIRFITDTGTNLSYWIDEDTSCNTSNTAFWVKVNSLPVGASTIYMYYGNTGASADSNGDDTFEFFDGFEGSSLSSSKWNINNNGTITGFVTGGYYEIDSSSTGWAYNAGYLTSIHSTKYGAIDNIAIEFRQSINTPNAIEMGQFGAGLFTSVSSFSAAAFTADGNSASVSPYRSAFANSSSYGGTLISSTDSTRYKVIRNGSNIDFYFNEGLIAEDVAPNGTPSKVGIFANIYSGIPFFDQARIYWFFVRKQAVTPPVVDSIGTESTGVATTGSLISNIYDAGFPINLGTTSFSYTGSSATVKIRSGSVSNLSDAAEFSTCDPITSGSDISTNNCIDDGDRYLQYQIELATSGTPPTFNDIIIEFAPSDAIDPVTNATNIVISGHNNNDWINSPPTITWTAGADNIGGVGLAGYCISLNQVDISDDSSLLNPETSGGVLNGLTDSSDLSPAACPYIVSGNSVNLGSLPGLTLTSNKKYYFSIKAIDLASNLWTGAPEDYRDLAYFRFDNTPPTIPGFISMPSNFISTKDVTITWPTTGPASAGDNESGLAGLQYRIGSTGTWYGQLHNGNENLTDLLLNNGTYVTDETYDHPNLSNGINVIYFRTLDNAGNISSSNVSGAIKLNTIAPGPVQNLIATPTDNTTNAYSFSWNVPTFFSGNENELTYCYTVNTLPTLNTCSFTGKGITVLNTDAFATQPGTNTLYIVAKDEAQNINYETYTSVQFTYSGSAPGIPLNVDVSDISNKDTSDWRLALAWTAPLNVGAGINKYKVYRATAENLTCSGDFGSFTEISTVQGTAYIDTGLTQQHYSYCVKACDSANSCSAVSGSDSDYPTGKYTTPALLTSGPTLSAVSTRKAAIAWSTARNSDSRIQYGTSSGVYFDDEVSRSAQVIQHAITINNLQPGTTYFYRTKWTDEDGNVGISEEKSFRTADAPTISDVLTSSIGIDFALIRFKSKGAQKVNIYYGKTSQFGGVFAVNTSTEESTSISQLTNLEDGVKYFFKINPVDIDGFEYDGTVLDFETLPRPRVLDITIQEIKGAAQPTINVKWKSNTNISSIIDFYPLSNPNLKRNVVDIILKDSHELTLEGLSAETLYILKIRGIDKIGNEAISDDYQFTTATDSRPPTIFNIRAETNLTNSRDNNNAQIIVSWETDELATSQVLFGEGSGVTYSQSSPIDSSLKYNHVIVISNLAPSKVYSLVAVAKDANNNQTTSNEIISITPAKTNSALELIINNLSDIFGTNF